MTEKSELESIYREAQSALKARDYVRASELLRQILVVDESYKDVSRLLAQTVKLRRRRWYNDPRLWGAFGLVIIVLLGSLIAPRLKGMYAIQPSVTVITAATPTPTLPPTISPTATATLLPTPTPIPLTWKRVSIGQEFERDTVTAFVIDPKDQDVLYASMKNAGIYKSIDGGLSWRPSHFGLSNTHVQSLSIDPKNPQSLYAGTLGGIFKTEDGGENWSRIGAGISLVMDTQNRSHLYARDNDSIYESVDQGKSWKTVYSSKGNCPGAILSLAIHPQDGNMLFVGGGEGCETGIYLSNDGGHTWTLKLKADFCLDGLAIGLDRQGAYYIYNFCTLNFEHVPPSTLNSVYYYWDSRLYKQSQDDDQTLILGKPDVGVVTSIAISPYDPNTIYVGGKGIAVSKDDGLTWTKLNNGLGSGKLQLNTGSGNIPILYLQSGECNEIHDPEHRVFQDDAGQPLYLSTNGGGTWDLSLQNGCYLVKDANGMMLYRVGQQWAWSTAAGHRLGWLWLSKDQGKTWQAEHILDVMIPFTVVAHPNQSSVLYTYSSESFDMVGPGGEKKMVSEDYGNNWKDVDTLGTIKLCYGSTLQFVDKYRPMAIDPRDGNHVFVIDNGTLLESHNSCDTTKIFTTPPNTSMNSIAFDPNNSGTLYTGTDSGAYISFDGGNMWNQINDGLLGATVVYSIAVDKDSTVYAATPYGVFKLESK